MPNRVMRDGLIYSGPVNTVSIDAECLFVRIVLAADDFGLIEVDPVFLKARCLPAREVSVSRIAALSKELFDSGLLRPYEHGGKRYAAVDKWDQRRFAKKPKYPMPPWGHEHIRGGYVDPRVSEEKLTPEPRVPTVGKVVRRVPKPPEGFDAFWSTYPKKVAKPAALRAWRALAPSDVERERMMSALAVQAGSADWAKDGGQYIPNPATWLNQRRFEDEPGRRAPVLPGQRLPDGSFKVAV